MSTGKESKRNTFFLWLGSIIVISAIAALQALLQSR